MWNGGSQSEHQRFRQGSFRSGLQGDDLKAIRPLGSAEGFMKDDHLVQRQPQNEALVVAFDFAHSAILARAGRLPPNAGSAAFVLVPYLSRPDKLPPLAVR
jgi:hypothetical protein